MVDEANAKTSATAPPSVNELPVPVPTLGSNMSNLVSKSSPGSSSSSSPPATALSAQSPSATILPERPPSPSATILPERPFVSASSEPPPPTDTDRLAQSTASSVATIFTPTDRIVATGPIRGQLSSVPRAIRGGGKSKEAVEVDLMDTDFEANRSTRPPDGLSLFPPTTDFGANLARELRYQGFHRSPSAAILPEPHTRNPPPAVDAQTVNQMVRDNTHAFRSKLQARTHGRRVRARKEKAGSYDVLKRDLMELRAEKAREGVAMRELLLDCARMFDIRGGGEILGDNGIETTQLQTYTLDGSSMPGSSEFSVVGEGEENISGATSSGLAATGQKPAHAGYFPKARVVRPHPRHAPDMRPKIPPSSLFTFPLHVTHKPASHGLQKQLIPKPFFHFCDTSRPTPHSFEPFLRFDWEEVKREKLKREQVYFDRLAPSVWKKKPVLHLEWLRGRLDATPPRRDTFTFAAKIDEREVAMLKKEKVKKVGFAIKAICLLNESAKNRIVAGEDEDDHDVVERPEEGRSKSSILSGEAEIYRQDQRNIVEEEFLPEGRISATKRDFPRKAATSTIFDFVQHAEQTSKMRTGGNRTSGPRLTTFVPQQVDRREMKLKRKPPTSQWHDFRSCSKAVKRETGNSGAGSDDAPAPPRTAHVDEPMWHVESSKSRADDNSTNSGTSPGKRRPSKTRRSRSFFSPRDGPPEGNALQGGWSSKERLASNSKEGEGLLEEGSIDSDVIANELSTTSIGPAVVLVEEGDADAAAQNQGQEKEFLCAKRDQQQVPVPSTPPAPKPNLKQTSSLNTPTVADVNSAPASSAQTPETYEL